MDLFGIKATLTRTINRAVTTTANDLAKSGLYNEKLFGWIYDNQPIFWPDNPLNYVVNGYQGNGDVFSCINKILTKLTYCPLLVYSVAPDKIQQAKKYKALAQHDFAKAELYRLQTKALTEKEVPGIRDLLNQPNKYQTTTEWLEQLAGFYLLNGNTYNYYVGLPGSKKWNEMYVLPAPYINIVSGGEFEPVKGYNVYNSINFNKGIPDFPATSVSHFKTFNPMFTTYGSQLYGQSPLMAYIMTLVLAKDSRLEQNKQIKNGGMMGMLSPEINAPSISDPRVKADLKQQIAEAKTSMDLVKRIFVAGAPAKWTQFGLPSVEMELLNGIKLTKHEIFQCYDILPSVMGDTSASTDNNMEHAMKQFIYNCIMTLGNKITDKLTRDICKPYEQNGEKLLIMFDYSVLPELADDLQKVATALTSMYWITINEKREFQGYGKSLDENADKILVPKTLTLLEDIAMTPDTFNNAFTAVQ